MAEPISEALWRAIIACAVHEKKIPPEFAARLRDHPALEMIVTRLINGGLEVDELDGESEHGD